METMKKRFVWLAVLAVLFGTQFSCGRKNEHARLSVAGDKKEVTGEVVELLRADINLRICEKYGKSFFWKDKDMLVIQSSAGGTCRLSETRILDDVGFVLEMEDEPKIIREIEDGLREKMASDSKFDRVKLKVELVP